MAALRFSMRLSVQLMTIIRRYKSGQPLKENISTQKSHVERHRRIGNASMNRSFVSSASGVCWQCGGQVTTGSFLCSHCGVLQEPNMNINHFELMGIEEDFNIDTNELTLKYRDLQRTFHPDRFSTRSQTERDYSDIYSSKINEAYRTLLYPLKRGLYLLMLRGGIEEEAPLQLESTFLMEILELSEKVQVVKSIEEGKEYKAKLSQMIEQYTTEAAVAYKQRNWSALHIALSKMKYYELIRRLILIRPTDPLRFLLNLLHYEELDVLHIAIIGAPCSGKHTLASHLNQILDVVVVDPVPVIKNALPMIKSILLQRKSSLPELVPPDMAALALSERLCKEDCSRRGWVIPGFPRNKRQLMELAMRGCHPSHIIFLNCPTDVLIIRNTTRYLETYSAVPGTNIRRPSGPIVLPLEELRLLYKRIGRFHRNLKPMYDMVGERARIFNSDQPEELLLGEVIQFLKLSVECVAPFNPRVFLIGPPGCGKNIHCCALALKYDLVSVNCGELIRRELLKKGDSLVNVVLQDEEIVNIVVKRLSQRDAITKGWVVRGFPQNIQQAELFHEKGFYPNRVVFLNLSDASCLHRLLERRVDPITGKYYHPLFHPVTDLKIEKRLRVHPHDEEKQVQTRLELYRTAEIDLKRLYEEIAQEINAEIEPFAVFEFLENILVRPNPRQLHLPTHYIPKAVIYPSPPTPILNYHLYHLDVDFVE